MKPIVDIDRLLELVKEVERADPIDWGMLPFNENEAITLIALGIVDQFQNEWLPNYTLEELHYIMLASMIKLVAENFALNAMLYSRKDNDVAS